MFSQIKDPIGRAILIVFLIKPGIDLLYFLAFSVGPIRLSPTTVFGALMCVYFARFRFSRGSLVAPYSNIIEAFIFVHLISIAVGLTVGSTGAKPVNIINIMLRLLDSYLIYVAAFLAMTRYRYQNVTPFVKAIVIGSALAVVLNVLAIRFGFAGGTKGGMGAYDSLRERGLYYDPGVLSNMAFFNLIFSVFLYHMVDRAKAAWTIGIIGLILADLYLINAGKSRAVMVELAVFGFIYLWLFQKRWGKLAAPVIAGAVLVAAVTILDIDFEELFVRFEGDLAALESAGEGDVGTANTGEITLGGFEKLGSNRGANWANALTEISKRSGIEMLFGNFSASMAHSDYVDILSRNGLIGFIMYCFILFALLFRTYRLARRRNSDEGARALHFIAFTLIACYMLYAIPFRPLQYTTTAWYMWAMLGFSMSAERLGTGFRPPQRAPQPEASDNQSESETGTSSA